MIIQTSNIAIPVDGQQELVLPLQRDDLETCSLGTVGNLQFNAEQGGTAPAPRAGAPLSEMNQPLADRRADLNPDVTGESSQARAQRQALTEARAEVRANSLLIGNLLGSLTAKVDEEGRFVDANDGSRIARALIELNAPSEGGLYSLKGAKYCLDTYLDELKEADLIALQNGVLSNEYACKDVLDKISTYSDDTSRRRPSEVLKVIAVAVNWRLARHAMHEPLLQIIDLLAVNPVDGQKLHEQLLRIPNDWYTVNSYFKMLSPDEFKELLGAFRSERLDAARQALTQVTGDPRATPLLMLDSYCEELEHQFIERAPEELFVRQRELGAALRNWPSNALAVSDALRRLSLVVEDVCQVYGGLSNQKTRDLQMLVEDTMAHFQCWHGTPNVPFLSRVDDATRANLAAALSGLSRFGLTLTPKVW